LWFWTSLALAGVPAGAPIPDAILVDVTPQGFDRLTTLALPMVPTEVAAPGFSELSGFCLWSVHYDIYGIVVQIAVDALTITPRPGFVDIHAELTLSANEGINPFTLYTEIVCISEDCDGGIAPFHATADLSVAVDMVDDGTGTLVPVVATQPLQIVYDLTDEDVQLSGCSISGINDFLEFFGGSLYDLFLPLLDDAIVGLSADLPATIDTTVNDALASLEIAESFALSEGVTTDLDLSVGRLESTAEGLRLGLDAGMTTPVAADCVVPFDLGTSLATPSANPAVGAVPVAVSPYDVGLVVSDDFVNQALYAVWRGGLLCVDGDTLAGADLPITLDTDLLGLLIGDVFDPLFPEPEPIGLALLPTTPPILDPGQPPIGVHVEDLQLDLFATVDGRTARLTGVALDVDAGLGLSFDGTTGALGVALDLSRGTTATVLANELAPGRDADIAAGLGGLLTNPLIAGVATSALSGLSFELPSWAGFGVSRLEVSLTDAPPDWLGLYVTADAVPYDAVGGCGGGCGGEATSCNSEEILGDPAACTDASACGSTGGATADDCYDASCASAPGGQGRLLALAIGAGVALRRRRPR
jgi:hypothetical protein